MPTTQQPPLRSPESSIRPSLVGVLLITLGTLVLFIAFYISFLMAPIGAIVIGVGLVYVYLGRHGPSAARPTHVEGYRFGGHSDHEHGQEDDSHAA